MYQTSSRISVVVGLSASLFATTALASPVYYSDRGSFDAANPGVGFEDFEDLNPFGFLCGSGPSAVLNSTTADPGVSPHCWDVGDVIPGFSVFSTPQHPSSVGALLVIDTPPAGVDLAVGADPKPDSLNLSFDNGARSIGLDVGSLFFDADILISLYDINDALVDSSVVSATPAGVFWGVQDLTTPIYRINFDSFDDFEPSLDVTEYINNMAFAEVPEPATLPLLLSGLGLLSSLRRPERSTPPRRP